MRSLSMFWTGCPAGPMARGFCLGLVLAFVLVGAPAALAAVHVKSDAQGTGDGTSWDNAVTTITAGLALAQAGTEVWVAAGSYGESLVLPAGVQLYGGFAGTETERDQRDRAAHRTVIDASTAAAGGPADHAVVIDHVGGVRLDGFVVTGGLANGGAEQSAGGGIWISGADAATVISGCVIHGNQAVDKGGGLSITASPVTVSDCDIYGNTAVYGGGFYATGASMVMRDCRVRDNTAQYSGGGAYVGAVSTPTFERTVVCGNIAGTGGSGGSGGGLYLTLATPALRDCRILSNSAASGGGLYFYGNRSTILDRVVISGNSAKSGGGVYAFAAGVTYNSCLLTSNAATSAGAIYMFSDNSSSLVNCTVSGNTAQSQAGGIYCFSSSPRLTNTIFTGNTYRAVVESGVGLKPDMGFCLFNDNPQGDYLDEGKITYTGAQNIDLNVDGAHDTFSGDPFFVGTGPEAVSGTWTAAPELDATAKVTVLTAAASAFAGRDLTGAVLFPDAAQQTAVLVLGNTDSALTVLGDATSLGRIGATYRVADYHLRSTSNALDRGKVAAAPALDMDAEARPGDDGLVDIGADEAPAAFEPPVDNEPPVSNVIDMPVCETTVIFDVPYVASDPQSGLAGVKLYYRRDGGEWFQYGGLHTASPVSFNSLFTGNDGYYEFYTAAVDNSGNTEAPPEVPDAALPVVTEFIGAVVHVDVNGSGLHIGRSWTDPLRTIGAGLAVAKAFGATELWVRGGIYPEALTLVSNVAIYGGFAGTEEARTERNPGANPTVIDASGAGSGAIGARVVTMMNVTGARLDGLTLFGGLANDVPADDRGGGILCQGAGAGNVLANLVVAGNAATSGGGLAVVSGATPRIENCVITGNSAVYGAGLWSSSASPVLVNDTVAANTCTYQGGGVYVYGGAVQARNVIFADNTRYAVYESGSASDPSLANCLFFGNPDGDYFDEARTGYTGANTISLNVPEAVRNLGGAPRFVMEGTQALQGTWVAVGAYDPLTDTTTLTADAPQGQPAPFTADALVGRLMRLVAGSRTVWLVTANDATHLTVRGNAAATQVGATYVRGDWHLRDGSEALDRGLATGASDADMDLEARPGGDGLVDIGADEAPDGYLPPPDVIPPVSNVKPLPAATTSAVFDVAYVAADAESGLAEIQLYYRRYGGAWTRYGANHLGGPASFDSRTTGGDGEYEFYTVAVDAAGTTEGEPAEADAKTLVVSSFTGARVLANAAVSGEQTGLDWGSGIKSLNAAVIIARDFGRGEVWVRSGTYVQSLTMVSGVAVYGGFDGAESLLEDRDPEANQTVIDASQAANGSAASHAVVMQSIAGARLDGFTITGGAANSTATNGDKGGGILVVDCDDSVVVANCRIRNNTAQNGGGLAFVNAHARVQSSEVALNTALSGGGVYIYSGGPHLTEVHIRDNSATSGGGGIYASSGASVFDDCRIYGNTTAGNGGGLYAYSSGTQLNRTILSGNAAAVGGGVLGYYATVALSACTLAGNTANTGGALASRSQDQMHLVNCQLVGNKASLTGGALDSADSAPTLVNCTLIGNIAASGGAVSAADTATLASCLIMNHAGGAVVAVGEAASPVLVSCLLFGNADGDVRLADGTVLFGGAAVDAGLTGSADNLDGNPRLAMHAVNAPAGNWTAEPAYDSQARRTTLTDVAAGFTPGDLAGRLVLPDVGDGRAALILDNTASTLTVAGNVAGFVANGDAWRLVDVHLTETSAALGAGRLAGAPAVDFEGDVRPGSDGAVDIGADESPWFAPAVRAVLAGVPVSVTRETAATISVSGTGVATYVYALDGGVYGEPHPVGTPIALTGLANGPHSLAVLGINADGFVQLTPTTAGWSVDTIAPAAPQIATADNPAVIRDGLPTLTWLGVPDANCYWLEIADNPEFVDAWSFMVCDGTSYSLEEPLSGTGRYYWRVSAIDAAGNVSAATGSSFRYLSAAAPSAAISLLLGD